MADIFDVVADPTRRELLSLLLTVRATTAGGEVSVGGIVTELGLSQPTVSKHLRVLRDHGLVTVREEGQHRYYRLDTAPLDELEGWLLPFIEAGFSGAGEQDAGSAVYRAWAGAETGERLGRAVAETSYRARTAVEDARERALAGIRRLSRR
ncbi:ArsR/SmtB family transcription factor [Galbitalea soli]|uniref:Winged helix-turn-helix transcriptional regulator n=1 Tax=Galbitalea soli TaxID=1268042 RepID=A0A7C9TPV6_9MICO|nr:metalloregulator ArsR/SmtB family transcription factor [Galbitalea soli]NEM90996.1 winged helix-turn-helix transcriptional regulator [Galbitalea soli]NYJ29683.1 DNA-binding transcriptional ArsR family regulator [Galbitalea soli]